MQEKNININKSELQFTRFLKDVEQANYDTNTTATGTVTIQQTTRNVLRKEGLAALKHDLELMYGDDFDILETKEGLVIAAENEPGDFTFSWEMKNTIKSLDYDPFIEADRYEDEVAAKEEKKRLSEEAKANKIKLIEEKRAKKLAELAARGNMNNHVSRG